MPTNCEFCKSEWKPGATHCSHCGKIDKELGEFELGKTISIISIIGIGILSTLFEWYVNNQEINFDSETWAKIKKIHDYFMYILIGAFLVLFYSLYFAKRIKKELKGAAK